MKPKPFLEVTIGVRFTKQERDEIEQLAKLLGSDMSFFIREAVRSAVRRNRSKLQMPQGG